MDKKILLRPEKGSFKKRQKNRNLPKGLVHGFCPKIELFIICVFGANQATKDRFGPLDKKNAL